MCEEIQERLVAYATEYIPRPSMHRLGWGIDDSAYKQKHKHMLEVLLPPDMRKGSMTLSPQEWGGTSISLDKILEDSVRHALWAGKHRVSVYQDLWRAGKDIITLAFDDYPIFESDGTTKLTRRASKRLNKLGIDPNSALAQMYARCISNMVHLTSKTVELYYHVSTRVEDMMMLGELQPDSNSCFGLAGENAHHTEVLYYGYPSFVVFVSLLPEVQASDGYLLRRSTQFRLWGYIHPLKTGRCTLGTEYAMVFSNPYNSTPVIKNRLMDSLAQTITPSEYTIAKRGASIKPNIWYNQGDCHIYAPKGIPVSHCEFISPYTHCPVCADGQDEWASCDENKHAVHNRKSQEPFCAAHRRAVDESFHACVGCNTTLARRGNEGRSSIITPCFTASGGTSDYGNRIYLCEDCYEALPVSELARPHGEILSDYDKRPVVRDGNTGALIIPELTRRIAEQSEQVDETYQVHSLTTAW